MAEPKPAESIRSDSRSEAGPKLVAVGDDARPASGARPAPAEPRRRSWAVPVLALLLALALAGLIAQTQRAQTQAARIGALETQVAGLETRLETAAEQLATYHRTLGLVRGTVSELFGRIADLNALVQVDPLGPDAPPAEPAAR